jgi:23S rRNA pseudouridine2605 synthase
VVTTLADPEGRPTVRDLLVGVRQRVFPVGRLDYHSAGLLLLTNDGALALRLTHPRYGVRKTYHVKVKGQPSAGQLGSLARGVRLPDGTTSPAAVHVMEAHEKKAWLSISLAEGKNRQVRRMCEAVGLPVEKLTRVAFGPLKLGKLPPGAWRHLEAEEVDVLRHHSGPEVVAAGSPGRRSHGRRRIGTRPDAPPPRADATAELGSRRTLASRVAAPGTTPPPRRRTGEVPPRRRTGEAPPRGRAGAPPARGRFGDSPSSATTGRRDSAAPPRRPRPRRPR